MALPAQVKSGSGGVTCLASGPRPGLVSGSREGIITSWATDSGVALQTIDVAQVHAAAAKPLSPTRGARLLSLIDPPNACWHW